MCVDSLGDGFEGVFGTGNTNKVGSDESYDGKHGGTAVTDLGLTEEGYEWLVSCGEAEGIELEDSSLEVLSSDAVIFGLVDCLFDDDCFCIGEDDDN